MNCPDFLNLIAAPAATWPPFVRHSEPPRRGGIAAAQWFDYFFASENNQRNGIWSGYWMHRNQWPPGQNWWQFSLDYVGGLGPPEGILISRADWPDVTGCYAGPAHDSARFMALERAAYRELTSRRPLSTAEQARLYRFDTNLSAAQFFVDDMHEQHGLPTRALLPEHDVQPYNYRDLLAGMVRVGERINAAREAYEESLRAEVDAILAGADPSGYSAQAQRIAADAQRQRVIDHTIPANLPGNQAGTVGDDPDAIDRLVQIGAGQQESLQARADAAIATHQGNLLDFWEENFPRVEVYRQDQLRGDLGQAVLYLRVTPRQKPLPHVSKFAKYGGLLSLAVSFIPAVGTLISQVISEAHRQEIRGIMRSVQKPGSIFEPQYYPQTYLFNVPGGLAAGVVMDGGEPWLLPVNVERLAVGGYTFDFALNPKPAVSAAVSAAEIQGAQAASAHSDAARGSGGAWALGLAALAAWALARRR